MPRSASSIFSSSSRAMARVRGPGSALGKIDADRSPPAKFASTLALPPPRLRAPSLRKWRFMALATQDEIQL
ncbi:MAG TPA: hypothetical protein VMT52_09750 [Planctomycetota bacterium]|nr:hypothetical protein [Planctomycetota bacterium]